MSNFKEAFVKAVDAANENGDIGIVKYRRLIRAAGNPKHLAEIEQHVRDEAAARGEKLPKGAQGAINWDNLLAFIQKLLPIILQIISIFAAV